MQKQVGRLCITSKTGTKIGTTVRSVKTKLRKQILVACKALWSLHKDKMEPKVVTYLYQHLDHNIPVSATKSILKKSMTSKEGKESISE
jgi:hypothetical protein